MVRTFAAVAAGRALGGCPGVAGPAHPAKMAAIDNPINASRGMRNVRVKASPRAVSVGERGRWNASGCEYSHLPSVHAVEPHNSQVPLYYVEDTAHDLSALISVHLWFP